MFLLVKPSGSKPTRLGWHDCVRRLTSQFKLSSHSKGRSRRTSRPRHPFVGLIRLESWIRPDTAGPGAVLGRYVFNGVYKDLKETKIHQIFFFIPSNLRLTKSASVYGSSPWLTLTHTTTIEWTRPPHRELRHGFLPSYVFPAGRGSLFICSLESTTVEKGK